MKLNKIKALCKASGKAILYTEHGPAGEYRRQWIDTGSAMFAVTGLPVIGTDNIPTLLGLKGTEKIKISAESLPEFVDTGDYDSREKKLLQLPCAVGIGGRELWLFRNDFQVFALDAAELCAADGKNTAVCLRHSGDLMYFAVFNGLFLEALLFRERSSGMDGASLTGMSMWLNWLKQQETRTEEEDPEERDEE